MSLLPYGLTVPTRSYEEEPCVIALRPPIRSRR